MLVTEIYQKYFQSRMLQAHQLRVAAVGYLILQARGNDNLDVVRALAVHDLGNMVRNNLMLFPDDVAPEGLDYWLKVQQEIIKKFGTIDHEASVKMLQEINVEKRIRDMVYSVNWKLIESTVKSDDMNLKILNYADMRVAPHGILAVVNRIDEVNKRKNSWPEYQLIRKLIVELEQQIFEGLTLKPEDINDKSVNKIIPFIKTIEIKTS